MTYKHSHAIAARVEWLGKLNDRRLRANEAGDLIELEAVAQEYELLTHPALTMAKEIRIAIAVRRSVSMKIHTYSMSQSAERQP